MNVELVKIRRFAMQAIEFRFINLSNSLLIGVVLSSGILILVL